MIDNAAMILALICPLAALAAMALAEAALRKLDGPGFPCSKGEE